jgi:UDP-N-acetyl-2-amino-2-deoxyglucuronate dehydrogenase
VKSEKVKIAIIGCGRVSGHHCRAVAATEGAELVAVCDLVPERAEAYHEQFGAKAYQSYHRMLIENPEITTVAVITPSGMHHEHALDVIARYKKDVIVEKPTFLKPSHVVDVYEAAKKAGVNVFAVFQNRHNVAVRRVLKGIRDGELGEIRVVAVRVRWCRPQRYYDMAPWRGTFAMDGGALTNQGIHHVDLLRVLGGEVEKVSSVHRTLGANIEVEDTAAASVVFRNGALGTVEVTTAARPNDYEASLSLVCDKGLAQIGGIAVNELQIYSPDPAACAIESEDFSGNVYGHGHYKIYQEIVDFVQKGTPYSAPYQDALSTIKLLNSFYVSDERKSWVDVDSVGDSARLGRRDEALADLYRTKPEEAA